MPRIIPCLDVRGGRVVKGIRFMSLRDSGDPATLAAAYQRQGADEIVMLDVAATNEQRVAAVETVAAIREVLQIPLTVGGGVDGADRAAALLDAGADKIAVNTAAVADPSLVTRLADRFGTQSVVIAIDAAARMEPRPGEESNWEVVTHAGRRRTGIDAIAWAVRATALGAGEVLLTGFDRDGTRLGYDLPLLSAVCAAVSTPVIASGGASGPEHLSAALQAGADAVLAASIFHDGAWTVADVKEFLKREGVEVRL